MPMGDAVPVAANVLLKNEVDLKFVVVPDILLAGT
jgi:hypothetical protein